MPAIVLLTFLASLGLVSQAAAQTISVRVVDSAHQPLPGLRVRLVEVGNCLKNGSRLSGGLQKVTNGQGVVDFSVGQQKFYLIVHEEADGLERKQDCAVVGNTSADSSVLYFQLTLRPDPSRHMTLINPSTIPSSAGKIVLGDFLGVYEDSHGDLYGVSLGDGFDGLEVSGPTGDGMLFPVRSGTSFSGPSGAIVFHVQDGKVSGLTLTPTIVSATKRP